MVMAFRSNQETMLANWQTALGALSLRLSGPLNQVNVPVTVSAYANTWANRRKRKRQARLGIQSDAPIVDETKPPSLQFTLNIILDPQQPACAIALYELVSGDASDFHQLFLCLQADYNDNSTPEQGNAASQ